MTDLRTSLTSLSLTAKKAAHKAWSLRRPAAKIIPLSASGRQSSHLADRGTIVIRFATPSDSEEIGLVHTQVWRELSPDEPDVTTEVEEGARVAAQVRRTLSRNQAHTSSTRTRSSEPRLVVAERGRGLIGSAHVGPGRDQDPPCELELYTINVLQGYHGSGVAQALLHAACAERATYLWVGRRNRRAVNFYLKHGFSVTGSRPHGEDWQLQMARSY